MSNIQTAETQGKPEFAHGSANLLDRWKLFRIVNRDSGLSSGARRVAFELLDGSFAVKHHPTQRYTKLTVKQVAALTGLHRNNVAAGFDNLIDRGYFTVLSQGHTGHARELMFDTSAWERHPHWIDPFAPARGHNADAPKTVHAREAVHQNQCIDAPKTVHACTKNSAPYSLTPTEPNVVGVRDNTPSQSGPSAFATGPSAAEGMDEGQPIGFQALWAVWNYQDNKADAEEMYGDALAWGMDADSLLAAALDYAESERLEGVPADRQKDLFAWLAEKRNEFKEAKGLVGPVVHEGPLAVVTSAPDGEPESFEALWAVWNRKEWQDHAVEAYRDALASGLGAQSLLTKAAGYAEWERNKDVPATRRKSLHKWLADMVAKADSSVEPDDVQPAPVEVITERYGFKLGDVVWVDDGEPRGYGVVAEILTDAEIAEYPERVRGVYVEFLKAGGETHDADQLRHAGISREDAEAHNVALFAQLAAEAAELEAEAAEIKAMLPFKEGDTVRKRYRGSTVEVKVLALYHGSAYIQGAGGGREVVPVTDLLTQEELDRLHAGKGALDLAKREAAAAERARKAEEARQAAEAEERRIAETNKQRWAEFLRSTGAQLAAIRQGAGLEVHEVEAEAGFDAERLEALEAGTLDIPVRDRAAMLDAYSAAVVAIREAEAMTKMFS